MADLVHSKTVLAPINYAGSKADSTQNALAGRAFFSLASDP